MDDVTSAGTGTGARLPVRPAAGRVVAACLLALLLSATLVTTPSPAGGAEPSTVTTTAAAAEGDVPGAGWRPGPGRLTATYRERARWTGGTLAGFELRNEGSDPVHRWYVEFSLPRGSTIPAWWNAHLVRVSPDRYRFHAALWNMRVGPGERADLGWLAVGGGRPHDVVVWPVGSRAVAPPPANPGAGDPSPRDPAPAGTATAPPLAAPAAGNPLSPSLECVAATSGGGLRAELGWRNTGPGTVLMPIGAGNSFSPAPADRGQPTELAPGTTRPWPANPFSVDFDGNPLTWDLGGAAVTATRASRACTVDVELRFSWVDGEGNDTDPPPGVGTVAVSVRSDLGHADCTGVGRLSCTYDNSTGDDGGVGLAVPVASAFDVEAERLPSGVALHRGGGTIRVPEGECGTTTRTCIHRVLLRTGGDPATTTTAAPTTTGGPVGTSAAGGRADGSRSDDTTTSETPSPSTTSGAQGGTAPTTTTGSVDGTGGAAGPVEVVNETATARTFVVECDRSSDAALRRFRLAAHERTSVGPVARGSYCSVFAEATRDGDAVVVPTGGGVVGSELDDRWAFAGTWQCGGPLVFTAREVDGPVPVDPPPGVRPTQGCPQTVAAAIVPAVDHDRGSPWPSALLGAGALVSLVAFFVASERSRRADEARAAEDGGPIG